MEPSSTVICMKCMAPNSGDEQVCSECGWALAQSNFLDPIASLHEQGLAHSKAIYKPTKPIVVITIWLLSLPAFIASVFGAIAGIATPGLQGFVFFWLFTGIAALSCAAMYKVSRNYLHRER